MPLKPSTDYHFSEYDKAFAMELAKIGHVHFLSNQVILKAWPTSNGGTSQLNFVEYGDKGCVGLVLPSNWAIEWIGSDVNHLSVTFGVTRRPTDNKA